MIQAQTAPGYAAPLPGQVGRRVGWISYVLNMYFIAVYAAALTPTLRSLRGQDLMVAGDSDVGTTVTWAILLVLMVVWVCRNFRFTVDSMRDMLPYLLIVATCFVSFAWSPYPLVTIRRSVTLSLCLIYGIYLFATFGMNGIFRLVTSTMVVLGILSIAIYVAIPSVGHDVALSYSASLRGVFATKNTAGEGMLLGICSAMYLGSQPGARKWVYVLASFFMFCVVLLTFSATSALLSAVVLGVSLLFWITNWRLRVMYIFCAVAGALTVAFVLVADSDVLFSAIGRDASLTGRLPLWAMVVKSIAKRPLLGYGYSGFWNADSTEVQYIWATIGWPAPVAHDGYLDIVVQIGVVGLCMYLYMWGKIIAFSVSVSRLARGRAPETVWIGMFMIVNIMLNIDEGPLPYPDEFTMLMPACLIFLGQARRILQLGGGDLRPGRPAPRPYAPRGHAGLGPLPGSLTAP